MLERLPELVDPLSLAEARRILAGRLQLAGMARLAPMLHSTQGEARFELEFGKDEQRTPYVRGHISAPVTLTCQRCLGPLEVTLEAQPCLGIISAPEQADALPENYEPLLAESQQIVLANIVEDELILALPVAPKHADTACADGRAAADTPTLRPNPFAVLARLKNR